MDRPKDSQEARQLREKVERDLEAAGAVAVQASKFVVRLAIKPKVDLIKDFIRSVMKDV
jgi:hypothetical protein